MKYEITGTIERDTWAPGVWKAGVKYGDSISGLKFLGQTPQEAHDAAQRYCDEMNAKAAEPKPPEGFCFSETPGAVDPSGEALTWVMWPDCKGFGSRRVSLGLREDERWLVPDSLASKPAAPKRNYEGEIADLRVEVHRLKQVIELKQRVIQDLVGAAPTRETRAEAEERWVESGDDVEGDHSHFVAFMRGAGFEP